jgi:soluble lytic murein transglycosylase-like protein
MCAPKAIPLMLSLLAVAACGAARADIYSFVDSSGVTHFSNVPTDSRYHLLLAAPVEAPSPNPGRFLAHAAAYDPMIERAARTAAVRPELVRAVIVVESAFNPRAVSKRGALGLMQLKPSTAKRYGVSDCFDPEQNITAGARYLRDLMTRFGNNLELALAAYNAGEDAVERYGRAIPPFSETRQYVPNVMRVYRKFLAQTRSS